MAVLKGKGRRHACFGEPLGVAFAVVAQRVVFGGHDVGRWQAGQVGREQW